MLFFAFHLSWVWERILMVVMLLMWADSALLFCHCFHCSSFHLKVLLQKLTFFTLLKVEDDREMECTGRWKWEKETSKHHDVISGVWWCWWRFRQCFNLVFFFPMEEDSKVKLHNWHDTMHCSTRSTEFVPHWLKGRSDLTEYLSLSLCLSFSPLISTLLAGLHHSSYLSAPDRTLACWKDLRFFSLNEYGTWGIHFNKASYSSLSKTPLLAVEVFDIWTAEQKKYEAVLCYPSL